MTLAEIREFPNTIDSGPNNKRVHESCLRSWQCLQKVRELLMHETPPKVILEIIDDIMDAPQTEKATKG